MTAPRNPTMSPTEWGLLILLSILWGGSFFFTGVAVEALPPFTIVALRVSIAALVLNLVLRASGTKLPMTRTAWLAFIGMGVLNNAIPFSLIVWGQTHIASGLASIFNATTPLFTVIVAHVLTRDDRMTQGRIVGLVVGFAGVLWMVGFEALDGLGTDLLAQLAVLGAALCYGFSGVFGRRFARMGIPPMATATGQVTASTMMLVPMALMVDQPWTLAMPGPEVIAAIIGLATLSTALAYMLFFRILASAGATNVSLVTFLIPISAIVLGAVVLGEQLSSKHFFGMTLIGIGLLAIDGRAVGWIKRMRAPSPGIGTGPTK